MTKKTTYRDAFELQLRHNVSTVVFKMNDRFKLNSELIREWLKSESRKHSYLSIKLRCSDAVVDRMLGKGRIPKQRTLEELATLMGVEVNSLLLPLEEQKSA